MKKWIVLSLSCLALVLVAPAFAQITPTTPTTPATTTVQPVTGVVAQQTDSARQRIAIFTPLYLDSAFDNSNEYKYAKNVFPKFINPGLEFYEGAQLALDSLNKEGAELEIFIYDTRSTKESIQQQLAKRGKGLALRVGIKKSGCSGFTYIFDYADEMQEDDQLFESHDARIIVKCNSLSYLDGSEIDFVKEGLNSTFKFNNPNTENTCGCGESFTV